MKDELPAKQIIRFCSLRAKMYSFQVDSDDDDNIITKKKAKGITQGCLK